MWGMWGRGAPRQFIGNPPYLWANAYLEAKPPLPEPLEPGAPGGGLVERIGGRGWRGLDWAT